MLHKIIYSLLITLLFVLPLSLVSSYLIFTPRSLGEVGPSSPSVLSDSTKKTKPPKEKEIEVAARVGGYVLNSLTGWTSPFSEVNLNSQGLARKTTADEKGFFAFYYIPVPENLGELCLISQDVNQLPSYPNCLAPPAKNMNLDIKDVLLSPTISLESAKIPTGKTAKASGMTFPNSEVEVYFFSENNFFLSVVITRFTSFFHQIIIPALSSFRPIRQLAESGLPSKQSLPGGIPFLSPTGERDPSTPARLASESIAGRLLGMTLDLRKSVSYPRKSQNIVDNFKLVRSAYAMGLPGYKVKSNQNGYFEFSLPATSPANNRIFATSYLSNLSISLDPGSQAHSDPGSLGGYDPGKTEKRSPKSNTLAFKTIGLLGIFLAFLKEFFRQAGIFFGSLKDNPFGIILIELGILLALMGAILFKKFRGC